MSFGNKEPSNWPHELRGKWEQIIAIAGYRDLQLIFAKTLEDMPFDQGSIRKNEICVKGNRIAHWSNRVLLHEEMINAE